MHSPINTSDPTESRTEVTVRLAGERDTGDLLRLAALDSAPAPTGPTVVAEVGGELVAAVPIDRGAAIADPFRRTAAVVQMLELHAEGLRASRECVSGAGRRGRRIARAAPAG